MNLFKSLGFSWDRNVVPQELPIRPIEDSCIHFHNMLPELISSQAALKGNPFTYSEVKTLLGGFTVGGHRIIDQEQIINLIDASKYLLSIVKSNIFSLDKSTFVHLHEIVARNEFLEWGWFRGEGEENDYTPTVGLGEHGHYVPLSTIAGAKNLNQIFSNGIRALNNHSPNPFERAVAFFLFGALQHFFFTGNKRTSQLMMNGILISSGIDPISIPATKEHEFNQKMVCFYQDRNATEMMRFMIDCHGRKI